MKITVKTLPLRKLLEIPLTSILLQKGFKMSCPLSSGSPPTREHWEAVGYWMYKLNEWMTKQAKYHVSRDIRLSTGGESQYLSQCNVEPKMDPIVLVQHTSQTLEHTPTNSELQMREVTTVHGRATRVSLPNHQPGAHAAQAGALWWLQLVKWVIKSMTSSFSPSPSF